jgi:hypothetical protein
MVRAATFTLIAVCALGTARPASAQEPIGPTDAPADRLGARGRWVIGAERAVELVGYSVDLRGDQPPPADRQLTLGVSSGFAPEARHLPRLSVDRVLGGRWSIGGSLVLQVLPSRTAASEPAPGQTSTSETSGYALGLAPRLGYVVPVARRVALWPRVGVHASRTVVATRTRTSRGANDSGWSSRPATERWDVAAVVEPVLAWFPVDTVALTLGPIVDVTLVRTGEQIGRELGARFLHVGLVAGLSLAL